MNNVRPKPVIFLVLDGLGIAPENPGNAVTLGKTPNLNAFWTKFPHGYLQASGSSVGLPTGVVGNSEVGHMGLGAGKVVFQEIARIDHEIENGEFYQNEMFKAAVEHVKKNNGKLHLMGLVSTGKVHSSMDHLYACLRYCKNEKLSQKNVFIHAFTDGRDTSPNSAAEYLGAVEKFTKKNKVGKIASVVGRYYAMDRDERWDRTRLAYELIVMGKGEPVKHWNEALEKSYQADVTDEFIKPHVVVDGDQPVTTVQPGDTVIFFNYRADRAVQLSKVFENKQFAHWQRDFIENLFFAGFSNYEKGIPMNRATEDVQDAGGESQMVQELFAKELEKTLAGFPEKQIFPPEKIDYSIGRLVSDAGMKQLRLAESEKYPHVTYFFSCREKNIYPGEDRIEVPSPKEVATYDLKPEMSTYEITNTLIEKIQQQAYDFAMVNFANTDMVAHTGNLDASIRAVQVADECMGKIVQAALQAGGEVLITSDHGNVEELVNIQTGEVDTEHSTNPVPCMIATKRYQAIEFPMGILADIGPTLLSMLGLKQPESMTGRNLLL